MFDDNFFQFHLLIVRDWEIAEGEIVLHAIHIK